jgi:hypothetical protein
MATLQATTIQSGVLAVKAGTAASPFIRNIGDTDTGIYKQDANTIGIATGGSQRARLNATGYFRQLNLPVLDCSHSAPVNYTDVVLTSSNFYDSVFINNGNHFNASTGRFTVPVAGYYHFSFQTNTASLDPNVNIRLRKNGVANAEAGCEVYNQNGAGGQAGSSNLSDTLYYANAGDYFDVQCAAIVTQGGTQHCRMFIYLIQ